jgi:hypothetical protein
VYYYETLIFLTVTSDFHVTVHKLTWATGIEDNLPSMHLWTCINATSFARLLASKLKLALLSHLSPIITKVLFILVLIVEFLIMIIISQMLALIVSTFLV